MNKNDLVILGLLFEKPGHGYEIIHEVKEKGMDHWANINVASIYNHLASLEEKGAVSSRVEKVGNSPERKIYTITDIGKTLLADLVIMAIETDKIVAEDPWSLGIAFLYGAVGNKGLEKAIKARYEFFKAVHRKIGQDKEKAGSVPFNWELLLRKTLAHFEVEIKYYKELLDKVEKEGIEKAVVLS